MGIKICSLWLLVTICLLTLKVRKHPGYAVAMIWSLFAAEQILQQGFGIFLARQYLVNLIIGAIALVAVGQQVSATSFDKRTLPKEFVYLLAVIGFSGLSTIWAPNSNQAISIFVSQFPPMVLFAAIAPFLLNRLDDLRDALKGMIVLSAPIILGFILAPRLSRGLAVKQGISEVQANPLAEATFGGICVIAAVFLLSSGVVRKILYKVCLIAISVLGLYVIYRSGSRGQLIGVVLTVLLFLPILSRVSSTKNSIRALFLAAVVLLSVGFFLSGDGGGNRWDRRVLTENGMGRLEAAQSLLKAFSNEPSAWMIGLGCGSSRRLIGSYCHIVPVEMICELGIPMSCLFFFTCFSVSRTAFVQLYDSSLSPSARAAFGFLFACMAFTMCLSLKQGSITGSSPMYSFIGCTAIATAIVGRETVIHRIPLQFRARFAQPSQPQSPVS